MAVHVPLLAMTALRAKLAVALIMKARERECVMIECDSKKQATWGRDEMEVMGIAKRLKNDAS